MPKKYFPPAFKEEAASLVLDQHYTRKAASEAMGVSLTALDRFIRQLRGERPGKTFPGLIRGFLIGSLWKYLGTFLSYRLP